MNEQKKKRQRIYDLLYTETKSDSRAIVAHSLSTVYQPKKKFLQKKSFLFLRKTGSGRLNKKWKESVLIALAMAFKDPTMSISKHANEFKVHKKTVRTSIEQDLRPDLNLLDYAIWGILENKTNATFHENIGLCKTTIEEEWNKMSGEFILKACWYNNWEKWWPYWVDLVFCVYLLILLFIFPN